MDESGKVPKSLAQLALLLELNLNGGEGDTGDIVASAMTRFPYLESPEAVGMETPAGIPWWPGRFRFDLNDLKTSADAENVSHGHWRITHKGQIRLNREWATLQQYGLLKQSETVIDNIVVNDKDINNEDKSLSSLSPTDTLIYFWEQHTQGTNTEKANQIYERIIALFLLSKVPEMVEEGIVKDIWKVFDRDELIKKIGSLRYADYTNLAPLKFGRGFDTVAEKLMIVFDDVSLTYSERCLQVCQRIFGIYSIGGLRMYRKIPEVDLLFKRIWDLIDFEELFRLAGELCSRGGVSALPYYEEFS